MGMRTLAICAATLLWTGCGDDCLEDRQVVEVFTQFQELGEAGLTLYESQGYDCTFDGSLLNAVGGVVGQRYVCSICA